MEKQHECIFKVITSILDHWMPHKIQYDEIPALSITLSCKGNVVYSKGFGYADIEEKVQANPATRYRIASISKIFTAIAVLQLQEQGKLQISDPVSKYIPWFKGGNKTKNLDAITIQQLLSHTSGLIRDGHGDQWESDNFPQSLMDDISPSSILYKNPAKFKYSNHGYAILGEVVKVVSGFSYNAYVQKCIIEPLGLKNTLPDFIKEPIDVLARGYARKIPTEKIQSFKHVSTNAYSPAAGFISTTEDIIKLLEFLNDKSLSGILSLESKHRMQSRISTGEKDREYGLGLQINRIFKHWMIGHSGGMAGFISEAAIDPKTELAVAVFANRIGANVYTIAMSVFGFFNLINKSKNTEASKILKNPHRYEGVYRDRWDDVAIIALHDQLIMFSVSANRPDIKPAVLIQESRDTFIIKKDDRYASIGEMVTFSEIKEDRAQVFKIGGTPLRRI